MFNFIQESMNYMSYSKMTCGQKINFWLRFPVATVKYMYYALKP
jgi:hypothetical protein